MKSQTRKRKKRRDTLIPSLLIIVALVLVVFEGKLVVTMVRHRSVMNGTTVNDSPDAKEPETGTIVAEHDDTSVPEDSAVTSSATGPELSLAGLSDTSAVQTAASQEPEREKIPTVYNPDSTAIVRKTSPAVDDSYFADAAFIGDSRMQGFRNASGITQGRFFTSVGMSLSKMKSQPIIPTEDGQNITVAAALSGGKYNKIYIMLGANDLGEYDWNSFREGFIAVTKRFKEIQPDALIYVCSCIYVEEAKVTTGDYVNNTNVDTINKIMLEICEQEGYHYLDLNEFLSNGYGSLIEGASSDGVHIYEDYCKQILEYMKTHYVEAPASAEAETESESETEADSSADKED